MPDEAYEELLEEYDDLEARYGKLKDGFLASRRREEAVAENVKAQIFTNVSYLTSQLAKEIEKVIDGRERPESLARAFSRFTERLANVFH